MSPEPIGMAPNTAESEDRGVAAPRYRLPPATRIGVVRLQVADLARSLAYYERVLGLRVVRRDASGAALGAAPAADVPNPASAAAARPVSPRTTAGFRERWNKTIGIGPFANTVLWAGCASPDCRRCTTPPGTSGLLIGPVAGLPLFIRPR